MSLTKKDVHVDKILTNYSLAFIQDQKRFIADKAFPLIRVNKESDKYFIWNDGHQMRIEAQLRAIGTASVEGNAALSSTTYSCEEYAINRPIADRLRSMSDTDIDTEAANYVNNQLLLKREEQAVATLFLNAIWGTSVTLVTADTRWDAYTKATSVPVTNFITAIQTLNKAGVEKESIKIIMGQEVWDALKRHPEIIALIGGGHTGFQSMSVEMLRSYLGVGEILIGSAVYNASVEGVAQSNAFIWGKHCLVVYSPPTAGLLTPTGGGTFEVSAIEVRRWRDEKLRSDVIEASSIFGHKLISTKCGYFFNTCID